MQHSCVGEIVVKSLCPSNYYQIFGFTIRKSLSVELKLLIKIISSFDNNKKCYDKCWIDTRYFLIHQHCDSFFFFFFINGFNHRYKKSFSRCFYFTWRCMCLYASVWISLYKYIVKHRGRRIVEFLRFTFYESSDKKNWILETAT